MIEKGTYPPGERIPWIRDLSRQMRVSINTVMQAYSHLEDEGMVEPGPSRANTASAPASSAGDPAGKEEGKDRSLPELRDSRRYPLSGHAKHLRTFPSFRSGEARPIPPAPIDKLNRMLATESRRFSHPKRFLLRGTGNERIYP